jgi:hypothetical protein
LEDKVDAILNDHTASITSSNAVENHEIAATNPYRISLLEDDIFSCKAGQPSIFPDIQYPDISNWKEDSSGKDNRVDDCSIIYPNFLTCKSKSHSYNADSNYPFVSSKTELLSVLAYESEPIISQTSDSLTSAIAIASPEFVNPFRSHSASPNTFFDQPNNDLAAAEKHHPASICEVEEDTSATSSIPSETLCRMSPCVESPIKKDYMDCGIFVDMNRPPHNSFSFMENGQPDISQMYEVVPIPRSPDGRVQLDHLRKIVEIIEESQKPPSPKVWEEIFYYVIWIIIVIPRIQSLNELS